ncbi:DUF2190 family protein [Anaerotignum propionicum]|uniref:Predicted phage recombinase, RecA/RadA family n=1 Tax=Anaerotignum propionicum DSM 1682 TaxID=991789 RepID=A0A0X1U7S1_ANAPI|nr:DUF2190 family protein [Anaerotignum propionicum]AMJ40981.1 hypothetical protein CPRO_13880 [Anaerotignum propionicum DSM 1682]SHE60376.1 Predicted phage recombinase, RecA/RadA family [[Clostridium] propionicum DSM 1682] [Anaerotignum propionicum DSM 1682]
MAKATYVQEGNSLDYRNVGSEKIEAGDIISLTTRVGVAGTDMEVGSLGSVAVTGVFSMPKATGAIALGALVYFNTTQGKITTTNTDVPAGFAIATATSSDATVLVKLLG